MLKRFERRGVLLLPLLALPSSWTWIYDFRKTYNSSSQIDRYECRQELLLSQNTHISFGGTSIARSLAMRTYTHTHTYDSQLPFHIWLFSLNLFRSDSLNVTLLRALSLSAFLLCSLFLMFSSSCSRLHTLVLTSSVFRMEWFFFRVRRMFVAYEHTERQIERHSFQLLCILLQFLNFITSI